MRTHCPNCNALVLQKKNRDGPNFCVACRRLFIAPSMTQAPDWILGVLAILVAALNLQVLGL